MYISGVYTSVVSNVSDFFNKVNLSGPISAIGTAASAIFSRISSAIVAVKNNPIKAVAGLSLLGVVTVVAKRYFNPAAAKVDAAALKCQSFFRGFRARKDLRDKAAAALKFQSLFRKFRARKNLRDQAAAQAATQAAADKKQSRGCLDKLWHKS